MIEIKASKVDDNDRLDTYSDGRENGSHYSQYVQSRLKFMFSKKASKIDKNLHRRFDAM